MILWKDRDDLQRDLDMLKWAHANLVEFNKAKSKFLHLGQGNPQYLYRLRAKLIENSPTEKNLGMRNCI